MPAALSLVKTLIPAEDTPDDPWSGVRVKLYDIWRSLVRTIVPIVAGAVASFAIRHGLNIKEAEVSAWLMPVVQGAWYSVPRLLEPRFPWMGWFLGLAKQPAYSPTPLIAPPEPAPVVIEEASPPEPDVAVMPEEDPDHHGFVARYDAKCAICDKTRRAQVHQVAA